MLNPISLPAPAKLNLFLNVLDQREDGYHNIQTLYHFIDFSDNLKFSLRADGKVSVKMEGVEPIELEENLIYRAAQLLKNLTNCNFGVNIEVCKQIPMGAGLGGASSNAATTLVALNLLWDLNLTRQDLLNIAPQLGADVAIFVFGHGAWGEGVGDELTPMIVPEKWYLLIFPGVKVFTGHIFQHPELNRGEERVAMMQYGYAEAKNSFEPLLRSTYPKIDSIFNLLQSHVKVSVSGSGSTLFVRFDTEQEAGRIAELLPNHIDFVICRGLNESPLHFML